MTTRLYRYALAALGLFFCLHLTACGGGGGSSPSEPEQPQAPALRCAP